MKMLSAVLFSGLLCLKAVVAADGSLSDSPSFNWTAYERGELGLYPQVTFQSSSARQPVVHVNSWSSGCDSSSYTFLTPRGEKIVGNRAYILDSQGHLVWYGEDKGVVSSLQVQEFKGHKYLTYWVGDDEFHGHGHGYYKMYDETYTLAYTISAMNGMDGDYHEFSITPDNTALITSYVPTIANLSMNPHGRENGFIWDCVFQEIDIEQNEVLFEWRASEFYKFSDMKVNSWQNWTGTEADPWDWFHLNSVSKDDKGNFLISGRYSNQISYLNGTTGEPIWNLGGKESDFTDITYGDATHFVDPHMARLTDDGKAITVFDNLVHWRNEKRERQSHGLKIALDFDKMIASVETEYIHPTKLFAQSEGSMQHLENGNMFIGYGSASVYSEFSPNGTLLCNSHFSPLYTNTSSEEPSPGYVRSYRTYKQSWTGRPREPPALAIQEDRLHISWNGATEVKQWKVLGRPLYGATGWKLIGEFPKQGYETTVHVSTNEFSDYKLIAQDGKAGFLRSWNIHPDGKIFEISRKSDLDSVPGQVHEYMTSMHSSKAAFFVVLPCIALFILINFPNFPFIRRSDLPALPMVEKLPGMVRQRTPPWFNERLSRFN